jgi:hypothetical protein
MRIATLTTMVVALALADPLTTGTLSRNGWGNRAASHFDNTRRAHSSDPWSASNAAEWQLLEYDRAARRVAGYNDRTGEVFSTAPGTPTVIGTGCAGCVLFDLQTCGVITPRSISHEPHTLVPYDRTRRDQLWRVASPEGVAPAARGARVFRSHEVHASDTMWHIVSERHEQMDFALLAWLKHDAIAQEMPGRRLSCLSGWCEQFASPSLDSFLSSLVVIPLPTSFLDSRSEDSAKAKWGCDTLARAAVAFVTKRASTHDTILAHQGTPRAAILHMAKQASLLIALSAETLAPSTAIATIYYNALLKYKATNTSSSPSKPIGMCDAPYDEMVERILSARVTSFTPEHVNVTVPVRALGLYAETLSSCALQQFDWLSRFGWCLDRVPLRSRDRMIANHNGRTVVVQAVQLLGALLSPEATRIARHGGHSSTTLVDRIAETMRSISEDVFALSKDIGPATVLVIDSLGEWEDKHEALDRLSCCYEAAGGLPGGC